MPRGRKARERREAAQARRTPHPPPRVTICPSCGAVRSAIKHGRCAECLPRLAARLAEHLHSSTAKRNIRKYGLTSELHAELFFEQKGVCAICQDRQRSSRDEGRGLVIDHDHETGEVRGLLCQSCNVGIGFLGDEREWLARAARYVGSRDVKAKRDELRKTEERIAKLREQGVPLPSPLVSHAEKLRRYVELRGEIQDRTKAV